MFQKRPFSGHLIGHLKRSGFIGFFVFRNPSRNLRTTSGDILWVLGYPPASVVGAADDRAPSPRYPPAHRRSPPPGAESRAAT
jgi:hypothetical protein